MNRSILSRFRFILAFVLVVLTLGFSVYCGTTNSAPFPDAGDIVDTSIDSSYDSGGDSNTDDTLDSGWDIGHEVEEDTGSLDTGVDSGMDGGTDSGADSGIDVGFDSGNDAGFDAGLDAGFDAGGDSGNTRDLYITGAYGSVPIYWKNGEKIALPTHNADEMGDAVGIAVSGRDFYIAGTTGDQLDNLTRPCFWKNGELNDLEIIYAGNSYAKGIKNVNGNIYIGGYIPTDVNASVACYWKNGSRIDIPSLAGSYSDVEASFVTDNEDVYLSGYYFINGNSTPCYWKNNTRVDLPKLVANKLAIARSIFVSSSDVYTAGTTETTLFQQILPSYWKNTTRTDLPTIEGKYPGYAYSIVVHKGDIYVGGGISTKEDIKIVIPGYWKNNNFVSLSRLDTNYSGYVKYLYFDGDDLYAVGYTNVAATHPRACYWKNGVRVDLAGDWTTASSMVFMEP